MRQRGFATCIRFIGQPHLRRISNSCPLSSSETSGPFITRILSSSICLLTAIESRLQILAGYLVRLLDHINLRSVSLQQANVLQSGFRIDDADKAQAVIHARLREADSPVAGARFDHDCVRLNCTTVNGVTNDAECRPVFRAAAEIQALQLCVELEARVRNHARQSHQRCVAIADNTPSFIICFNPI